MLSSRVERVPSSIPNSVKISSNAKNARCVVSFLSSTPNDFYVALTLSCCTFKKTMICCVELLCLSSYDATLPFELFSMDQNERTPRTDRPDWKSTCCAFCVLTSDGR